MKQKMFILVLVLISIVTGSLFVARRIGKISTLSVPSSILKETIRFREITIPSLRARTYKSALGPLEKLSETSTYTSYLTSYTSEGLKINGLLTIPKGESLIHSTSSGQEGSGQWPAIVFVHGYVPPKQYETTSKYVEYVDYLARNGFVVFKIDLRGHGNSEGQAGGGYYGADYVIDTLNARAALESADFVDASKIGLWGHSMAGNTLMRAFAARPQIPAVVIWAGAGYTYTDLQTYRISDVSYRSVISEASRSGNRREIFAVHGQFSSESLFWKEVVATNYLSDLKGAIEIHHAVDDSVVSIEYSRNLMKLLDVTSVPHQLYEYSNGGHNISGTSFSPAMSRTVEFFKKKLMENK